MCHSSWVLIIPVKMWNGWYFEPFSLREAGLIMQLGHDGGPCSNPHDPMILTIIDFTGIHHINVRFCDCGIIGSSKYFVQMLRAGWWPASLRRPKTGFTVRLLELFHALTLQSKTNGYDFYRSIVRMTDGSGLYEHRVRIPLPPNYFQLADDHSRAVTTSSCSLLGASKCTGCQNELAECLTLEVWIRPNWANSP